MYSKWMFGRSNRISVFRVAKIVEMIFVKKGDEKHEQILWGIIVCR
jgi:hypothetical protein